MDRNSSQKTTANDRSVNEDYSALLFNMDTLLSEQYFDTLRRNTYLEPEKRLMLAILQDAVNFYQDNYIARSGKKKRLFDDVKEWISSADSEWVFSFENVCDALGLNAAYIRGGLLQWNRPSLRRDYASEMERMAG